MKHILVINHASTYGGAGISLEQVVDAIDKKKNDVTIYCNSDINVMADIFVAKGYKVVRALKSPITFSHYSGASYFIFSPVVLINMYRIFKDREKINALIAKINPDIVVVNSMTLFWVGDIIKKHDKKAICFDRESFTKGLFGIRTRIIKHCLNKYFDKIAFISKYDSDEIRGEEAKKVVIYDKVDVEKYSNLDTKRILREKLGLKDDLFYVLYLGGASKLKGAELILKAMSYINDDHIKLVFMQHEGFSKVKRFANCQGIKNKINFVLGRDYEYQLSKIFFKYNLNNKVIFRPSATNIQNYFGACDVVVFPSTQAHQARPIYEAGAAKIPIIITDFQNTKEFVKNNYTGFEFKNNDILDLVSKIMNLYEKNIVIEPIITRNFTNTIENHNIIDLKQEINKLFDI